MQDKRQPTGMGVTLREYRLLRGMTQYDLADAAGVSRLSIQRYETGKAMPKRGSMELVAKALGVTTDELMKEV